MICSKFITFVVTKTTTPFCGRLTPLLWFAQNSLPLWWQRQHLTDICREILGCDLLKIHYLCGDKDNRKASHINVKLLWFAQNSLPLWWQRQHDKSEQISRTVVICSKFITFVVTKTTLWLSWASCRMLWFAQNSLPLWWQRQQFQGKHN